VYGTRNEFRCNSLGLPSTDVVMKSSQYPEATKAMVGWAYDAGVVPMGLSL
jgi:hypothetical protein